MLVPLFERVRFWKSSLEHYHPSEQVPAFDQESRDLGIIRMFRSMAVQERQELRRTDQRGVEHGPGQCPGRRAHSGPDGCRVAQSQQATVIANSGVATAIAHRSQLRWPDVRPLPIAAGVRRERARVHPVGVEVARCRDDCRGAGTFGRFQGQRRPCLKNLPTGPGLGIAVPVLARSLTHQSALFARTAGQAPSTRFTRFLFNRGVSVPEHRAPAPVQAGYASSPGWRQRSPVTPALPEQATHVKPTQSDGRATGHGVYVLI